MTNLFYRLGQVFAGKLLLIAGVLVLVVLVLLRQASSGQGFIEDLLFVAETAYAITMFAVVLQYAVELVLAWTKEQEMNESDDPFSPPKAFIVGCLDGFQRLRHQFKRYRGVRPQ